MNNMDTITIPMSMFDDLLEKLEIANAIIRDLEFDIENSELDYYKENLIVDNKYLCKKYCRNLYNNKLNKLKRELTQKESESEK